MSAETAARGPLHAVTLRMLTSKLWLIALALGLVIFTAGASFDLLLQAHREAPAAIIISNGFAGILAAALVYTLLAYGRKQRRQVLERLETLHEVNHNIRNALQSLAFAAGTLQDRKESAAISEAIKRIQWTLLEVLPKVEPSYEPFQGSARAAVGQGELQRRLGEKKRD